MVAHKKKNVFGKKIEKREEAIEEVYGKNSDSIKLSTGEIITGWSVENFPTFNELVNCYSKETAIAIYDSGM